jgi:hypothetical protein
LTKTVTASTAIVESKSSDYPKEVRMSQRRTPTIERILHRIEEHVEQWRNQDRAHKAEAAAQREKLWAEAAEREKLLAEAIAQEQEVGQTSVEETTERHRVVFVAHSEEMARTLETFAQQRNRLVNVVPSRGSYGEGTGIKGSWLVFEPRGESPFPTEGLSYDSWPGPGDSEGGGWAR